MSNVAHDNGAYIMDAKVNQMNQNWNRVFSVIQQSQNIQTHWDYFVWLQNNVAEFIPHDMLLAVWGDFNQSVDSTLDYDAASNVEGIRTRTIMGKAEKMDNLMLNLYQRWVQNSCNYYAIDDLNQTVLGKQIKSLFPKQAGVLNSLMVYGVRDTRGETDCLYVFFYKDNTLNVKPLMLDLIIPHIDHALRKITLLNQLEKIDKPVFDAGVYGLSDRELEVVSWIKAGKTNQEIGMILNISQNTVKSHLKRIFQKLNVGRRAQAVALLLGSDLNYHLQQEINLQ